MFAYVYEEKKVISVILLFATLLGLLTGFCFPNLAFSAQKIGKDGIQTFVQSSSSGCWVMVPTKFVPGHEDWACYGICSSGCSVVFRDPIELAVCYAACYGGCYVPSYWEYEPVWYDPCPQ